MTDQTARERMLARVNPSKLRAQAATILQHPNPHPKNVALAASALRLAKWADGK